MVDGKWENKNFYKFSSLLALPFSFFVLLFPSFVLFMYSFFRCFCCCCYFFCLCCFRCLFCFFCLSFCFASVVVSSSLAGLSRPNIYRNGTASCLNHFLAFDRKCFGRFC